MLNTVGTGLITYLIRGFTLDFYPDPPIFTADTKFLPKINNFSTYDMDSIALPSESLGLAVLPLGWQASGGHTLKSPLLVQLRTSQSGVLAITYLDAEEYGWGKTENDAITDLMTSLVEYMESL